MLHDITQVALERAMQGAALRQTALAANLANANTPGYRRREVDFHSTLAQALDAGDPRGALAAAPMAVSADPTAVVRADGSSVDVDLESAALAENALDHAALAQAAKARIQILRAAIGVT